MIRKNNKDEYDFCGIKCGECAYQINADKKIWSLEKQLEHYKKAFELACVSLEKMCDTTRHCDDVNCPIYNDCVNNDNWEEHFLQKARKEE